MSFTLLGILNSQAAAAGGAGAYDLLETQVLSSSASSVTFTGLGSYSDYKHLQIRAVIGKNDASTALSNQNLQVNSDTGSNYAWHTLEGDGSTVYADNGTTQTSIRIPEAIGRNTSSGIYATTVMDILDFSSTSKNTTFRWLTGGVSGETKIILGSGLYANTSAISTISFINESGAGSRFSLYGIK